MPSPIAPPRSSAQDHVSMPPPPPPPAPPPIPTWMTATPPVANPDLLAALAQGAALDFGPPALLGNPVPPPDTTDPTITLAPS